VSVFQSALDAIEALEMETTLLHSCLTLHPRNASPVRLPFNTVSEHLFAPVVAAYRKADPAVAVELGRPLGSSGSMKALQAGVLDLAAISRAPLALTPREHSVLEMLMMKTGKTVSKRALAESLFSIDEEVNPDAIEIYVHRVRRKLEPGDAVIVTLRGLGYLLKPRHVD